MLSKYNQIADQTSEEILAGLEAFEAIYQETFKSTHRPSPDSVPADVPAGPEASGRKRHPTELSHYTPSNQFLENSRSRASHHLSSQRLGCQPVISLPSAWQHQALTKSRHQAEHQQLAKMLLGRYGNAYALFLWLIGTIRLGWVIGRPKDWRNRFNPQQ